MQPGFDVPLNRHQFLLTLGALSLGAPRFTAAGAAPTRAETEAALKKACAFFSQNCSNAGGYTWRVSRDFRLSEGEGETTKTMCWVQPPGTPSVGMTLLDVYEATGDTTCLNAAKAAAYALAKGQRLSGGWYYSIEFDPAKRKGQGYRDNPNYRPTKPSHDTPNLTMLDDDTTPSALRFLMRMDKALQFKDATIKNTLDYALKSVLLAQYPNGAWHHNYDRWPTPHNPAEFPVIKASYPKSWPRTWDNAWTARYQINDDITGNLVETMLLAHEIYGDQRFLASAKRAGDFFLLAQMPDPQPAWAQQYDPKMQPVWERKFEPPAISGLESQYAMEALLRLVQKTGDTKYLEPFPRALAYLKKSLLKDGRIARFYELHTNKPLSFMVVGKQYNLTYDFSKSPDHYGFIFDSRLGAIEAEYNRLKSGGKGELPIATPATADVRTVITSMDPRGAWIDKRGMKGYNKASPDGVYQSETFIKNVGILCAHLRSTKS